MSSSGGGGVAPVYHLPYVVRIKCKKDGTVVTGCDTYVGRACTQGGWRLTTSEWANPFKVAEEGRGSAIEQYEIYIREKIRSDPTKWLGYLVRMVSFSRALSLGCFCKDKPDIPCHGDVIVKLAGEVIAMLQQGSLSADKTL